MALEIRVSNLTPLISFATRAAAATAEDLADMQSEIDALTDRVEYLYDIVAGQQPEALIIISHGQSLARRQLPQVTMGVTIADYRMPVGGIDREEFVDFTGNDDHLQHMSNFADFVPLEEHANGESWGSGLGYQFRQNSAYGPMMFFAPADGARHWRELRFGASRWGNLIQCVHRAYEILRAEGELNIGLRFFWTHIEAECDILAPGGGTNELVISAAQTAQLQEQVLEQMHHTMSICFDRDMSHIPVYVTPLNSAFYIDLTLGAAGTDPARGAASRYAQAGQLAAAKANSQLILLPPHYQFYTHMNGDGVHLGGGGRRLHAELCASVAERVEAGGVYMAPHVLSATRSGATITATCHFPGGGGGVRDTTTFADPGTAIWPAQKYGIQFWKGSAFVTVSDATISGSTLTVTLASDPGAGAGELRVAQQAWPSGATGTVDRTPRSNFRDAVLSVEAQDGTDLYHYMIPQTVAVA